MDEKIQNLYTGLPYLEMGSGFMMGLSVGYVVKKSFKLMLFLTGLILIALFILENQHIITLNESSLDESITTGTAAFQEFVVFLKDRLRTIKVAGGVSAAVGFVAGLKMG